MEEMNNNENMNVENTTDQAAETTAQTPVETAEPAAQAAEPAAQATEAAPQTAEPAAQAAAPAPEKKPNNALKFIIPIVVLLVLVAILAGVALATGILGGGNGKKEVTSALMTTFTESGDALKEVWNIDGYEGMFDNKQMSIDADLTVADEVGLEVQYNKDDQISGMYMDVSYLGSSMVEAVLYMDEEEVSLGLPNLIDYVFYVDRTTLEEDIQNLVDNGMIDEETAESIITLNQGSQDLSGAEDEIEQGGQDILNAIKDIYNEAEVEKADSKTLEVNGEDQDCKGYVITITAQQLSDFFLAYKEVYEENEAFRNYVNQLVAMELGYDSVEEFLEYEDPAEEFQNLADEALESEYELTVYFYLYDGVVAQIYVEEDEDNYLEWNIKGGNFPLENTELILVIDGEEGTLSRSGSMEDDSYSAEYALDIAGEELYMDVEYDKSNGDFSIDIYDYYSDCVISGNIESTIPGSELVIEIDSFELDYEEILYGDITISNECGDIEKPEGDELNVMELSMDDWYEILEEIMYSMY